MAVGALGGQVPGRVVFEAVRMLGLHVPAAGTSLFESSTMMLLIGQSW